MPSPTPARAPAPTPSAAQPWSAGSWRALPARQAPSYPDPQALERVCSRIAQFPPLVIAPEVRALRSELATVAAGQAFLLQGGDCAEDIDAADPSAARETFRVLLQMAVVLTYAAAQPIVKVGRMAGQYAKPRSSDTETRDGIALPSYRGDIINGVDFDPAARQPDPQRMLRAYSASAATLNLLRALAQGGFADLHRLHGWTTRFVRHSAQGQRYQELADRIGEALAFMAACGFGPGASAALRGVNFYTSHEALLLPYEEALTRSDAEHGPFAGSAHMLWLGERTRQPDGAHVEYLRGIANPVGVKVGPTASAEDLLALLRLLDPQRTPGRMVLITRMGAGRLPQRLPALLEAVRAAGHPVIWSCDPMHGNTVTSSSGLKTRDFDRIMQEVREFFLVHEQVGTVAGGLHVELTGDDVTECRGGGQALDDRDLARHYTSTCDPRLNGSQSLELAFLVADLLKARRPRSAPATP